ARTVEHFTGSKPAREHIQGYKNRGGFNDDWKLSHQAIRDAGVGVRFEEVKDYFQSIFHGNGTNGLILRERWIAQPGALENLSEDFRFAVFTGRLKWEAELTLNRFAGDVVFDPVIGFDEVENHKPAPDGLLGILKDNCDCKVFYIGDSVDDARCARAAKV